MLLLTFHCYEIDGFIEQFVGYHPTQRTMTRKVSVYVIWVMFQNEIIGLSQLLSVHPLIFFLLDQVCKSDGRSHLDGERRP